MVIDDNRLGRAQGSALIITINIGNELAREHPEIADQYRSGKTHEEIAEMLDVAAQYRVSDYIAKKAIGRALIGNEEGLLGLEPYVGLIPDKDERERIASAHLSEAAKKTEERQVGIHGKNNSTGERYQVEGGLRVLELRLGIHKRTAEQKSEDGRKGAIASLKAQGRTPFTMEELVYAHALSQQDNYRSGSKSNNTKIAAELNERFHEGRRVRKSNTVGSTLCVYRKSLVDKV